MAKKKVTRKKKPNQRSFTRFEADLGTLAFITRSHGRLLERMIPCLVREESYGGCGLIAMKHPVIAEDAEILIQVGHLGPLEARVRWVKTLDTKSVVFGIEYVES